MVVPAYLLSGVQAVQPPHLEGDSTFATEILPGPPPLASLQHSAPKRDPRKPFAAFTYLPPSDPGSTYSALAFSSLGGGIIDDTSGRKRARRDKSASSNRAQRASARNLSGAPRTADLTPLTDLATKPGRPSAEILDSAAAPINSQGSSTAVSSQPLPNAQDMNPPTANGTSIATRKDKGKSRESERAVTRVKEEPLAVPFVYIESAPSLLNEDYCSACRSSGALVYCDGCPRAFHFWCLDPPMEADDLPDAETRWFCPKCTMRKKPGRKPAPSLMSPLLDKLQTTIPSEFQLPDDIRNFFKDVSTGPRGNYVDTSEIKQPRLNRHGQLEDRDSYRLKDRNGAPVLCFRCGESALPDGIATTRSTSTSLEAWKNIISCDYCGLHWHQDCVDPPLPTIPPEGKKWMCPNHADKLLRPKPRIPKQNATPIDITKPGQFNNGNIEVIHDEAPYQQPLKEPAYEVLINSRRYRIPERVILLDFWKKLSLTTSADGSSRGVSTNVSSPLTSLSSLEADETPCVPSGSAEGPAHASVSPDPSADAPFDPKSAVVQAQQPVITSAVQSDVETVQPEWPDAIPDAMIEQIRHKLNLGRQGRTRGSNIPAKTTRRRLHSASQTNSVSQTQLETRRMRSRSSKGLGDPSSISSPSSVLPGDTTSERSTPLANHVSSVVLRTQRNTHIKVEHDAGSASSPLDWPCLPDTQAAPAAITSTSAEPAPTASRQRVRRKNVRRLEESHVRRGRKRKQPESEESPMETLERVEKPAEGQPEMTESAERAEEVEKPKRKKAVGEKEERATRPRRRVIPPRRPYVSPTPPPCTSRPPVHPVAHSSPTKSAIPSLKIRLPRLSDIVISRVSPLTSASSPRHATPRPGARRRNLTSTMAGSTPPLSASSALVGGSDPVSPA